MTPQDIRSACLPREIETASLCLMDQEIDGTQVNCHVLPAGETVQFSACENFVRILFFCAGEVTVEDTKTHRFTGRGVYIGKTDRPLTVAAQKDAKLLELCRWLEPEEFASVLHSKDLPYMGSVETYGTDLIAKHTHPMLEQFFFGLDENNCIALIDDVRYPFTGNMLLHIPLGSDHGVLLEETHACHYLWMDFLLNEEALRYMDEAHRLNN